MLYWFIALFPFLIYPWSLLIDPHYALPKVIYLILFAMMMWLVVLFNRSKWTEYIDKRVTNLEMVLLLLYVLVGISTILSVEPEVSRFGMSNRYEGFFALISYFSLFLFAFRLINLKDHKKVMQGLVGAGVIVAVYGILQHYQLDFLPRNSRRLHTTSSYGFFDQQNFFGTYLVLVTTLAIVLFLLSKGYKHYYFYLSSSLLLFISMIFTYTRSALVGLFVSVIFLTIFIVIKKRRLWLRWIIILALFLCAFITIDTLESGKYASKIGDAVKDTSNIVTNNTTGREGTSRWFIWEHTYPLIKDYFWTGSGPDTLYYIFPPNHNRALFGDLFGNSVIDKAHNEYLQIAVTLGIPALVAYLLFIVLILIAAFKAMCRIRDQEDDYLIHVGITAAIVGYLVQAFFNISVVTVAPFFWVLLGLCFHASYTYLVGKT